MWDCPCRLEAGGWCHGPMRAGGAAGYPGGGSDERFCPSGAGLLADAALVVADGMAEDPAAMRQLSFKFYRKLAKPFPKYWPTTDKTQNEKPPGPVYFFGRPRPDLVLLGCELGFRLSGRKPLGSDGDLDRYPCSTDPTCPMGIGTASPSGPFFCPGVGVAHGLSQGTPRTVAAAGHAANHGAGGRLPGIARLTPPSTTNSCPVM